MGVKYGLFFLKLRGPNDSESDKENQLQTISRRTFGLVFPFGKISRFLRKGRYNAGVGFRTHLYSALMYSI